MQTLLPRLAPLTKLSLAVIAGLGLLGCPASTPTTAPATTAPTTATAPTTVRPGSHEDWCDEHAVAESQCARCHPELIAAFKATNDWCDEHGLPESQCLKCHPELQIVRPARGH